MQPDAYRKLSQYRVRSGRLASRDEFGNNGAFCLPFSTDGLLPASAPSHQVIFVIWVIVSDQEGWDHVSAHVAGHPQRDDRFKRIPTWEEMCLIKSLFFDPEEAAMQLHPPESKYINHHAQALHIWRPQNRSIPMPPVNMV